ncbi:MAG: glycosyltransferase, partial [Acidimicrobiia bacterium]
MALPNGAARGADVLTELPQPTGGAHPKTVAIVVTYNRRDVVRRTLASIETQTLPPDATYVVDNGSSDGTAEMMQREFPQVRVIQLRDNPGPAAGFAAAMRTILEESDEASVDFFWTMDDDSCPAPDALETLLGAAAELQHVEVGVLAWKGGRIRRGAIQQLPNAKLDPLPNSNFGYRVRAADFSHVDGSLIARRAVERAGLPRADLFIMFEDYEYTMRIRETGLTVAVLEEDLMTRGHLGAGTRDGSSAPWRGYYQTRNHLRVALDRRSGWLLLGWAIRQVKLSVATVLFQDRKWERLRFRALGLWHALRGRLGRTIEPDAARPRLPGDRVRSTTRRGSVVSHRSPRVAIGLPVRNGERYLSEAIDSLLAQSFTDFE